MNYLKNVPEGMGMGSFRLSPAVLPSSQAVWCSSRTAGTCCAWGRREMLAQGAPEMLPETKISYQWSSGRQLCWQCPSINSIYLLNLIDSIGQILVVRLVSLRDYITTMSFLTSVFPPSRSQCNPIFLIFLMNPSFCRLNYHVYIYLY